MSVLCGSRRKKQVVASCPCGLEWKGGGRAAGNAPSRLRSVAPSSDDHVPIACFFTHELHTACTPVDQTCSSIFFILQCPEEQCAQEAMEGVPFQLRRLLRTANLGRGADLGCACSKTLAFSPLYTLVHPLQLALVHSLIYTLIGKDRIQRQRCRKIGSQRRPLHAGPGTSKSLRGHVRSRLAWILRSPKRIWSFGTVPMNRR